MSFPNSEKGLKQIFNSMADQLATVLVAFVGIIYFERWLDCIRWGCTTSSYFWSCVLIGVMAVFGLGIVVAAIAAVVLEIIGILNCSKDEPAFKLALLFIIAGRVFQLVIVGLIFGAKGIEKNSVFMSWATVTSGIEKNSVFIFFATVTSVALGYTSYIFIIKGVINFANKLQNKAVKNKGETLIAMFILTALIFTVSQLSEMGKSLHMIANLASLAGRVMAIVSLIMYFIFIKRGKEMLANAHD